MKHGLLRWLWRDRPRLALAVLGLRNNVVNDDQAFVTLVRGVYQDADSLTSFRDLHNLYRLGRDTSPLPGDMAEVGVYRGGSARVLCEVKGLRRLHLFDTFEGIPGADARVDRHHAGDYADTSIDRVRTYLQEFDGVLFYKGRFPDTAQPLAEQGTRFSFVHLDVDVYESTRSALEFFIPRLVPGGILVSHDFRSISCPGVRRAFEKFFHGRPERVVELWDTQCVVWAPEA
jgi:hypothetical protein